jgi:predicted Zn-dependent protease
MSIIIKLKRHTTFWYRVVKTTIDHNAMKPVRHLLVSLLIVLLAACSPGIRFKPGEIPSPSAESSDRIEQGRYAYQQLTNSGSVYRNRAAEKRVSKIISRILSATPPMGHWEITLLDAKEFNAMTTPGNYIYVYRGLLEELTEDEEVAAVLSHEIAHRLARHDIESTSEKWGKAITLIAGIAAGVAVGSQPGVSQSDIANTMDTTIKLGSGFTTLQYSKDKEREADQVGIFLMADAGYDPSGFASVWARRASKEGTQGDFFSTHPNSDERYKTAIQLLPQAKERYRLAKKRRLAQAPNKKGISLKARYEASEGFRAIRNRDAQTATSIAQSLTAREPHYSDGYNILGLAQILRGNPQLARKNFQKGLRIDPDNAALLYNMACVDAQAGRHTSALSNLEKSFTRAPELLETAQSDTDLNPLRSNSKFHELITRHYTPPPPTFNGSNSYSINTQ